MFGSDIVLLKIHNAPIVSIIIVNYNAKQFSSDCVASNERHVTIPFEIILVDNDSQDGSAVYVRKNLPQVILIESSTNLGFAKGNNLGAKHARGDYILLLNNDTVLETDLLPAVEIIENNFGVGVVGAKMMGKNGEYRLSAGHFPEPFRLISFASLYNVSGPLAHGNFPYIRDGFISVDWVEGSFQFMLKSLWQRLGGMDEGYFMYVEDVDFCRSAKELGHTTVYCPKVIYTHFGGYGHARLGMLVSGFRRYHAKYSKGFKRYFANAMLDVGLAARLLAAAPGAVSGNEDKNLKVQACANALFGKPLC